MNIKGLSHITLGVKDLGKSQTFYSTLFSIEPKYENTGKDCHFMIGELWFVLVQDDNSNPASGYSHIAFFVAPEDFQSITELIQESQATLWQNNESHGQSLYFKDPDGHKLEIHSSTWQDRFNAD